MHLKVEIEIFNPIIKNLFVYITILMNAKHGLYQMMIKEKNKNDIRSEVKIIDGDVNDIDNFLILNCYDNGWLFNFYF